MSSNDGTTKRVARWMVSSAHVLRSPDGDVQLWDPQWVHHARELGTIVAACGRYAATWTNFYFRAYVPGGIGSCAECDRAIELSRLTPPAARARSHAN